MAVPPGRLALATAAVLSISLVVLGWNISATRIGSASVDPVAHVLAQDESMYVNSAIRMTKDGDWLNPKLMGRLFLFKAPLLQWLSALSVKLFGLRLISVRLPALMMGAAGIAVVFAWTALIRSWPAAVLAAMLLASDSIWMMFSRLCFTDVLASTLALLAMFPFASDPQLTRLRSRILFGAFAGAAVLAKSIVGVLPFAAASLYLMMMPRPARPRISHIVESAAVASVVSLPWPLYQAVTHPQWFWIEFVKFQLLAVGVTTPTGVTGYAFFYLRRLAVMDPVLCVFFLLALCTGFRSVRKREPVQMVAVCWTLSVAAALAVFRGRSVSYLVLLTPALCLLAGMFLPRFLERRWIAVVVLLIAAFGVEAGVGALPYRTQTLNSVAAIRNYYLQNRDAELIIAAPDDSFYAITLPRLHVRYCYIDPAHAIAGFAPHYLELGIAVTPDQLAHLSSLMPEYLRRSSAWGIRSEEPVGSAILLESPAAINKVLEALPGADYDVPASWEPLLSAQVRRTHALQSSGERLFLLAHGVHARQEPAKLPPDW